MAMAQGQRAPIHRLSPARRRWLIARALLRALGTASLLVVLYYALPLDGGTDLSTILALCAGLLVLLAALVWQVRSITRSQYPGIRAIEALAATTPLYILLFASAYFLLSRHDIAMFNEPLSRSDALYFSVTTLSSTGFGDIAAHAQTARMVVTGQMLLDLVLLGLGVRVFLTAVSVGHAGRAQEDEDDGAAVQP
jgi:voltage-gated potassium channel